jgi:hypothetical protein
MPAPWRITLLATALAVPLAPATPAPRHKPSPAAAPMAVTGMALSPAATTARPAGHGLDFSVSEGRVDPLPSSPTAGARCLNRRTPTRPATLAL